MNMGRRAVVAREARQAIDSETGGRLGEAVEAISGAAPLSNTSGTR